MNDSATVVPPDKSSRFITGYAPASPGAVPNPVPHWDFEAFAPAGAIRSSLNDMLKFAMANLYPNSTPLGLAIQFSQAKNWGWDSEILNLPFPYKNGGTGGFMSLLVVDPKKDFATVMLTEHV